MKLYLIIVSCSYSGDLGLGPELQPSHRYKMLAVPFLRTTDTFTDVCVSTWMSSTKHIISHLHYMFMTLLSYQEMEGMVVEVQVRGMPNQLLQPESCFSTSVGVSPLEILWRAWVSSQLCLW